MVDYILTQTIDTMLFIFSLLILLLLALASYQDVKTRNIDNNISFSIIILCVPLIIFNYQNFTGIHALIGSVIFAATIYKVYGPADMRVILPLIFTLTKFELGIFFIGVSITAGLLFVKYKKEVPFFVAITAGYVVAIIV